MKIRFTLFFLFVILMAGLQTSVTRAGGIAAPVQKWTYGGCINGPYCATGWYASPAVADLDGDNQPEVIWGGYDLYALNGADGSVQWEAESGSRIWPGIAVADLTGNGSLEVIVGRNSDTLTVYNSNGSVAWTRNPFGSGEIRTLAVADLEEDGQLEIIVGRGSGGATKQVNVYEPDGSVRPGWPARHDDDDGYGWGMYNENVTVADMDGDGFKEIFAPTDTHYITALARNGEQLEVNPIYSNSDHNDNGRITWAEVGVHVDQVADLRGYANCGTEHRPNFANAAPAIADVNGDDVLELVTVGDVYNCGIGDPDGDLYYLPWILNLDRTRWSGDGYNWTVLPNPAPGSGPLSQDYTVIENIAANTVVADLDGDGLKEILYPSYDGRLHAYWLDKTQHGNWPYDVPGSGIRFASEPIVVDLDNDGHAEVIFSSWPEKHDNFVGQLHILDYLGNSLHAINLPTPAIGADWNGGLGAPTIANIDGDADLELVTGTSHSGVVAYDLPGSENARLLWGTGRGSFLRDGVAPAEPPSLVLTADSTVQTIAAGGTAVYPLAVTGTYTGTVTLTAIVPGGLDYALSETAVTLPAQVTLTVTDTTALLAPVGAGLWYNLSVTATAGEVEQTVPLRLLVGGYQTYLPFVSKP